MSTSMIRLTLLVAFFWTGCFAQSCTVPANSFGNIETDIVVQPGETVQLVCKSPGFRLNTDTSAITCGQNWPATFPQCYLKSYQSTQCNVQLPEVYTRNEAFGIFQQLVLMKMLTESETDSCQMQPMGMASGDIPDTAITASSIYNDYSKAHYGRLNSDKFWHFRHPDYSPWFQVDFGDVQTIAGVVTQGRPEADNLDDWIKTFSVTYGDDETNMKYIEDGLQNAKIFIGNFDRATPVTTKFPYPVLARFIRINPITWGRQCVGRFEILGCYRNNA